jgi:hypothetical protein
VADWQGCGSNLGIEFAAAPRDNTLIGETQLQTAESNFESGRAFIIADKKIRHTQRERIERAASRNTKLAKAGAA